MSSTEKETTQQESRANDARESGSGKSPALDRRDRTALLFRRASELNRPVILILEGVDFPAQKRIAGRMARVLDPRHFHVYHVPHSREGKKAGRRARPMLAPYWLCLPRYSETAIHEQSYYHGLVRLLLKKKISRSEAALMEREFLDFEETLRDDGYIIIKLYFGRPRKELLEIYDQKVRTGDRYRLIKKRMLTVLDNYKRYTSLFEALRERTDSEAAPWHLIPPAADKKSREALVMDYLIQVMEDNLGIDSIEEVRRFDEAMHRVRSHKKAPAPRAAATPSAPEENTDAV